MRTELALAWRLVLRQWRAGDLHLMLLAAVLAVTVTTLLAAFGDRLERGLVLRAGEMLGADLVLAGSRPPGDAALAVAGAHRLAHVQAADFTTMLAAGERALLVSVRAADDGYPLRGELRIAAADGSEQRMARGPAPGEIWIEARAGEELGVAPGDRVEVGYLALTVSAFVTHEPDRAADFSAFSPRALMNRADLPATRIVQPGSRVRYRTLFAGDAADVAAARTALDALRAPHEEVLDVRTGSRRTATSLARALQFLSLAGVFGIVLCGAAIGIAADRQSRRLYDTVALLRTFGLAYAAVWRVLLAEIALLALVAGALGTLLGLAAQAMLATLLADLLPQGLPPPGIAPRVTGFVAAAITVPAFALPPLARLAQVSPLRVLRRDLAPPATRTALHYAAGMAALAVLVVIVASDRPLAATLLGAVVLLLVATVPLAAGLLALFRRQRARVSLPVRLAIDRLAHTPWRFGAQLVAFALILTTMTLTALLRDDLFASWQRQLPADAPNVFAINLLPHERAPFLATLGARGITPPALHPVTPGRLVRIGNDTLAQRLAAGSDAARALDRDLILTQGTVAATQVTAGRGQDAGAAAGEVSVEEKLAQQLALDIGDTLTFLVEGREITARVTGFRRVDWDSFQPNFYMILSPGTLGDAPYTWLTSFHTDDAPATVRELRAQFPSLTLLEVGPLLARMNQFVGTLAGGIEFVLGLLLAAALVLLVASVAASLDERLGEAALLRVLGARRRLLRQTLFAEFALLGAVAGLLAMIATELARWQLYTRVMELPWSPLLAPWLLVPAASALLVAAAGWLAARRSLAADAGTVLKDA